MPIIATWMRGNVVTIRPLPSFVTRQMDPVSATPKFAPVIPMSARRNSSRSRRRAVAASTCVSSLYGTRSCRSITRPTSCRVM